MDSSQRLEYAEKMLDRYKYAYIVARALTGVGSALRLVGMILTVASGIYTIVSTMNSKGLDSARFCFVGIGVTILVLVGFNAAGDVVSAIGQMLKATLDTAINTSPFLRDDQKAEIMLL